jgi:hypothetical protein
MIFRLDRFFFDEKDVAVFLLGVFLVVSYFFQIPVLPFKFENLVLLFIFLIFTRSMRSQVMFEAYVIIALLGLFFSLFLSPYSLAIYLLVASLIYIRSKRV